jgi:hypothetical protein
MITIIVPIKQKIKGEGALKFSRNLSLNMSANINTSSTPPADSAVSDRWM